MQTMCCRLMATIKDGLHTFENTLGSDDEIKKYFKLSCGLGSGQYYSFQIFSAKCSCLIHINNQNSLEVYGLLSAEQVEY